jgi:hypothetical protein
LFDQKIDSRLKKYKACLPETLPTDLGDQTIAHFGDYEGKNITERARDY